MKLLFVHQNLGDFGGAEVNVQLSACELRQRGHQVGLLYTHGTGRNEQGWRETFSECYCLPSEGNVETVEAVLERFQPDLVYLHNLADLEVVEALLKAGPPTVRMVHDHALYCMRSYKYNYFTRNICQRPASMFCVFPCLAFIGRDRSGGLPLKWVSYSEKRREIQLNQQCARLVVYSQHQKEELVRNGFEAGKVEICVPIRLEQTEEQSTLSARNLVLFAGQIIRGKGVDTLLRALAKVRAPFECVILGDGHHRIACQRLCARLGLQERVKFQGYVLPAELKEYYRQASVFVVSSLWPEPFGMTGPEAMRYGVPVVAYDAGGIREWLHDGQNGFLVPWNDTERFAGRIEELLSDKELARQLGRRAQEQVKHYDAARQIDGLERLFQQVLHQRTTTATAA